MKLLVIYYSKTGFTKKYAQWIKEATGCDIISFNDVSGMNYDQYDTVLFASWFHAGSIQKLSWYKELKLQNKKRIVLSNGAMPPQAPEVEAVLQNNFKEDRDLYHVFYVQGGLSYEKMGFVDKNLMKMFCKMVKSKEGEDSLMYKSIASSFDATSKEALKPLLSFLEE